MQVAMKQLVSEVRGAGSGTVTWDGKDQTGSEVASGISITAE